jgi:hypothetical protein
MQKALAKILEVMNENVLQERLEDAQRFGQHVHPPQETEARHRITAVLPTKRPVRINEMTHAIATGFGLSLPCLWVASKMILSI